MSTTDAGRLGEAKVIASLVEQGWYPFTDISGKCPIDILAWKDNRVIKIQVKATAYQVGNSYTVSLRSIRPNRTKNTIKHLDWSLIDYLAVYVEPLDKTYFVPATMTSAKSSLAVDDRYPTELT